MEIEPKKRGRTERRDLLAGKIEYRLRYWNYAGEEATKAGQTPTANKAAMHVARLISKYLSYQKTGKFKGNSK